MALNGNRPLWLEQLETRRMLASDCFQNPIESNDVNNDRAVTLADLRIVFTSIIDGSSGTQTAEGEPGSSSAARFLDVNGDGELTLTDLRGVFVSLLGESGDTQVDEFVAEVAETLQSSDTVDALLADWRSGPGATIAETIDDLLAESSDRIATLRGEFQDYLDDHQSELSELYDELDAIVAAGLADNEAALADLHERFEQQRQELQQRTEDRFAEYLEGSRLRERINELVDEFGLESWQADIDGFINDVESGAVTLTPEAQALFDLATSDDLQLTLSGLRDLDRAETRTGIVDLLDAYDDSGRDLPNEARELRDALTSGQTLLGYLLTQLPFGLL